MATLNVTRSYSDGNTLFASDLDAFLNDIETFLNTTKVSDDNLQDAGITGSTKLIDGSVPAVKLASDAVTTVKMLDANVTTAKLADASVTTAKIADVNVTTGKLADASVTTAKLSDGSVTRAKQEAVGQQISSACTTFSSSSTSYVDVTNLSVSITTAGRPVYLSLISDGSGNPALIGASSTIYHATADFKILRGASEVARVRLDMEQDSSGTFGATIITSPPGACQHLDPVAAGTYTYKVQAAAGTSCSATVSNVKLVAFEL